MKRTKTIIVFLFFMWLAASAHAAITSVTLTPLTPTDTLSNGKPYYLAGKRYLFRVQAVDPAATGQAWWNNFDINFVDNLGATQRSCTITISPIIGVGATSGVIVLPGDITNNTGGIWTNIDFTIGITIAWNGNDLNSPTVPTNSVQAVVRTNPPVQTVNNTRSFNYGICSRIQIMNFAGSGDAADGLVNPWHAAFNVTGRIVYFVAGEPLITNRVNDTVGSDETNSVLPNANPPQLITGGPAVADADNTQDVSFPVGASYMFNNQGGLGSIGAHNWSVQVRMVTGGAVISSSNAFPIFCNRIQINNISFTGGGGRNIGGLPGLAYSIRSVLQPGTQVQVDAQLQVAVAGSTAMIGNTTFVVMDAPVAGATTTVTIAGGQTIGSAIVAIPAGVPLGTTQTFNYHVEQIYGGAFDGNAGADGQNQTGRIALVAATPLAWDRADPPGQNAPTFTVLSSPTSSTAVAFTLNWTPLNFGPPYMDGDFDTYRVYYRVQGAASFTMVDKLTFAALGTITTGTVTITGLTPLTNYEFRISATDLFGNEVSCGACTSVPVPAYGNQVYGSIATTATTVEASITDGISIYSNADFNNHDPSAHKVRQTTIKVTVFTVTAGTVPDQVNILIANNDSDIPGAQFGITGASNSIVNDPANVSNLVDNVSRWRIPCVRVLPNTYEAMIPSDHPVMQPNANIRFIIEQVIGGAVSYVDHTPDPTPPGDVMSDEWRFQVSQTAIFIPWPTRILNNVMTTWLPCCYPAYFLIADALVSIRVYDIKGRLISVLADNQFRPGGQNIKEGGWCGRNKDNNRVGPGLYYIHIKAKSYFGKVILDKTMKVVVKH